MICDYIFCRDYYYNHIVNKKPISQYLNYYNSILWSTELKDVIACKRHYELWKDKAQKREDDNLLYCTIRNRLEKNNNKKDVNTDKIETK